MHRKRVNLGLEYKASRVNEAEDKDDLDIDKSYCIYIYVILTYASSVWISQKSPHSITSGFGSSMSDAPYLDRLVFSPMLLKVGRRCLNP